MVLLSGASIFVSFAGMVAVIAWLSPVYPLRVLPAFRSVLVDKPSLTLFFARWRLPVGRKPSSVRMNNKSESAQITDPISMIRDVGWF